MNTKTGKMESRTDGQLNGCLKTTDRHPGQSNRQLNQKLNSQPRRRTDVQTDGLRVMWARKLVRRQAHSLQVSKLKNDLNFKSFCKPSKKIIMNVEAKLAAIKFVEMFQHLCRIFIVLN